MRIFNTKLEAKPTPPLVCC